jgi:hypothetical protein
MGTVPIPVILTAWGLLEVLSVKVKEALRVPAAAGANVTFTVQALLGVSVAPVHVSALLAKSPAFAPPSVTVEMERSTVPVLVTVTG